MGGLLAAVCFTVVGMVGAFAAASGQGWLWLVVVLLSLGTCALLIWLAVRLSLAVPITFAERRIALFDSFALTKGRTMPLLGMAIIVFIMTMLVGLLSSIIAMPITLMSGGGLESLAAFEGQTTMSILQQAGPMIAAWVVLNALFSALQLAVMYAPFSAAYRDIKGLPVEP
jgi:membrane-anchored glycerophosphoryl diester phosphodiesterase (GDPDase)